MALAIFDLDDTLLAGDSDYEWGKFLCDEGLVDPAYRQQYDDFYQQYLGGDYDVDAELDFACEILTHHSLPELHQIRQAFMRTRAEAMILPKAVELVESHRQAGDQLMVITATLQFIVEPIVERFGIATLIASVPEMVEGRYTGKIAGVPSFREGKVTRLKQWLDEQGPKENPQQAQGSQKQSLDQALAGSWFYSDSHNDLPLLNLVDNPVAVDPNDRLRAAAEDKGWKIISLR